MVDETQTKVCDLRVFREIHEFYKKVELVLMEKWIIRTSMLYAQRNTSVLDDCMESERQLRENLRASPLRTLCYLLKMYLPNIDPESKSKNQFKLRGK